MKEPHWKIEIYSTKGVSAGQNTAKREIQVIEKKEIQETQGCATLRKGGGWIQECWAHNYGYNSEGPPQGCRW